VALSIHKKVGSINFAFDEGLDKKKEMLIFLLKLFSILF